MTTSRAPYIGPSAWRPSDFSSKADFSLTLSDAHLDAFDRALAANRAANRTLEDVTRQDFPLDAIADDVDAWRHEVLHGRGFVVLANFPVERYDEDDIATIYWGLGTHFGRAVSQSNLGDRLGHVIDVGGKDRRERAYRNSRELTLHTDRADLLGMLCLHKAMQGGISGYASIHTIYNDILASKSELLEPLFRGFHYHRFGEQRPGEPPVTPQRVPLFSELGGKLSTVFLRAYIEMGARELDTELSAEEVAALDYFEEVARRDNVKLQFLLQPGEAIFFNNCILLHNRTSFEDDPDPARRRHLLRLWLMLDDAWPWVPAVQAYKGVEGIAVREDGTTYYSGDATPEPVDQTKVAGKA